MPLNWILMVHVFILTFLCLKVFATLINICCMHYQCHACIYAAEVKRHRSYTAQHQQNGTALTWCIRCRVFKKYILFAAS